MTKDEALKMALAALEGSIAITMVKIVARNEAIAAIKQALLAQPEQITEADVTDEMIALIDEKLREYRESGLGYDPKLVIVACVNAYLKELK